MTALAATRKAVIKNVHDLPNASSALSAVPGEAQAARYAEIQQIQLAKMFQVSFGYREQQKKEKEKKKEKKKKKKREGEGEGEKNEGGEAKGTDTYFGGRGKQADELIVFAYTSVAGPCGRQRGERSH